MSDASALRARTPHSSASQADGAAAASLSPPSDAPTSSVAVVAAVAPSSSSRAQHSSSSRDGIAAGDVELQSLPTATATSPRSTATVRFHVDQRADVPAASAVAKATIRTTSKIDHEGAWASSQQHTHTHTNALHGRTGWANRDASLPG